MASVFKTQITKLHHQVVKCTELFFSLLMLFYPVNVSFETKVFPFLPLSGPFFLSLFYATLLHLQTCICFATIPFSILHFVFFCFRLGEEGIHTEELETDLGKIFSFLNKREANDHYEVVLLNCDNSCHAWMVIWKFKVVFWWDFFGLMKDVCMKLQAHENTSRAVCSNVIMFVFCAVPACALCATSSRVTWHTKVPATNDSNAFYHWKW